MISPSSVLRIICRLQAIYFIITGLWGILHIESFMAVTGPKFDIWLVKTVSALIIPIGISLLVAAQKKSIGNEILILAVGSALGLTIIDVYYVFIDRISSVYLLDAVLEVIIILLWIIGWVKSRKIEN